MARQRQVLSLLARSIGLDLGAALLCVLVFWLPLVDRPGWPRSVEAWTIVLLIVGMLLRSRWPVVAFCLVTGVTLAGAALGTTHDPFVAAAWTLFPVAVSRGSTRLVPAVSVTIGLVIVLVAVGGPAVAEDAVRYVMVSLLVLAGTWALGSTTRQQRWEAEHALRAEKEHAVTAERLRVAREVHDVVSHSLGTISVGEQSVDSMGTGAERDRHRRRRVQEAARAAGGARRHRRQRARYARFRGPLGHLDACRAGPRRHREVHRPDHDRRGTRSDPVGRHGCDRARRRRHQQ